jgi:hypothetical protein
MDCPTSISSDGIKCHKNTDRTGRNLRYAVTCYDSVPNLRLADKRRDPPCPYVPLTE